MESEAAIQRWFCQEVLPLEAALTGFVRRNWRQDDDTLDIVHDIYERVIAGARQDLPRSTSAYVFAVARNHLINRAKRARIISFEQIADLESTNIADVRFEPERQLAARDALRHVQAGLDKLSPRVREVVVLRKVEGLNVVETADRLGIGKDAVNHQLAMGMKALADHMLGGLGKIIRRRYTTPREEGARS